VKQNEFLNLALNGDEGIPVTIEYHAGKSFNNRDFILKCMENYAQRKILFRDTKWSLRNMLYRARDD